MTIPDYHGVLIPLRNRVLGQRKKNRAAKARRAEIERDCRRLERHAARNHPTL
jgi:hypothetical protein